MALSNKLLIAPLVIAMTMSTVWAQTGGSTDSSMAAGKSDHAAQDVSFVKDASAASQTEIMASRLASSHAASSSVKSFASTMIQDHTMANNQLKHIAQNGNYMVSPTPNQMQQASIAQLQPLHGKDFDAAYKTMMMHDHQEAVALFQTESTSGNDGNLKAFAMKTLPTLQHHLTMANTL